MADREAGAEVEAGADGATFAGVAAAAAAVVVVAVAVAVAAVAAILVVRLINSKSPS